VKVYFLHYELLEDERAQDSRTSTLTRDFWSVVICSLNHHTFVAMSTCGCNAFFFFCYSFLIHMWTFQPMPGDHLWWCAMEVFFKWEISTPLNLESSNTLSENPLRFGVGWHNVLKIVVQFGVVFTIFW
jgi:hypothetical protein